MFEQRRVVAVVPAFNEGAHVADVIRRMPEYVDHIIVVDDCSSDDTSAVARGVGDARVEVLRQPQQSGVGGAMIAGLRRALERQADLIVKVDGDGQMDPAQIATLLKPLVHDGYDYAKANRFLHTTALQQMPLLRLIGNFSLTFLTKLASGYWHVFDPQNGYVAITASALSSIDLSKLASDFFFENSMLIQLNILNYRVKDVAMPAHYGNEVSSLRIRRVVATFPRNLAKGFCLRVWEKYMLRDFSPIALFLLVGAPLMFFSGLFGLLTWAHSLWTGQPATTGTVMLSVLPFLIGFELVLQALMLEIRDSPR